MAQPYSAKQLEYFKTTLNIIHSAVFKITLDVKKDETPSVETVVSEIRQGHPTIEVANQPIIVADNGVTTQSIGIVESSNEDALEISPVAKVQPVKSENSATFFQSLPWHVANETSRIEVSSSTPETASVGDDTKQPISSDFFQTMPWENDETAVISTEVSVISANEVITALIPTVSGAEYFQAIPWEGQVTIAASPTTPIGEIAALVKPEVAREQTCTAYFQALPWGEQPSSAITDAPMLINKDEFAMMAQLATQSALQAAQRSVDKQTIAAKTATEYFHDLPW